MVTEKAVLTKLQTKYLIITKDRMDCNIKEADGMYTEFQNIHCTHL